MFAFMITNKVEKLVVLFNIVGSKKLEEIIFQNVIRISVILYEKTMDREVQI